jgi:GNAT superfamily N-acetyltransferase
VTVPLCRAGRSERRRTHGGHAGRRLAGIERRLRADHARGRRRAHQCGLHAGGINAVFTLEEERGKGYASACVAALSRHLLDRGWRYRLIFVDRDNPITTRIYQRLGYRKIATFSQMAFDYGN